MSITEIALGITAIGGLLVGIAALIYQRKQPELNQAQAASELINSESVKTEIARSNNALNAARDLRILDLEKWADNMRPTIWKIKVRDDAMCTLIKGAYTKLELPVPDIPEFPEIPEFPPPRVLT